MVLGLVLHTCAAFSQSAYWIVSFVKPLAWAEPLADAIHVFRMPLFFMISGFFAYMMMEKQKVRDFCSTKIIRIGIPFLCVLLAVNLPQFLLLSYLDKSNLDLNINNYSVTGHLWFLVNLLFYFFVYVVIHKLLAKLPLFNNANKNTIYIFLITLVTPVLYICLLAMNKLGLPIYRDISILGSFYQLFAYFDYFILGALLARIKHEMLIEIFTSISGGMLFVLLLFVSLLPLWFDGANNIVAMPYIEHLQAIFVSLIIWVIGFLLINNNSIPFKALANASYSIYLFHHVIIILLVLLCNFVFLRYHVSINANIIFIFIMCTSLYITIIIHNKLIAKNKLLSFLFNGKSLFR